MRCVACLQGDFHECRAKGNCETLGASELGSDGHDSVPDPTDSGGRSSAPDPDISPQADEAEEEVQEFRTYKDDSALRDQQSTGRKRAAKMYPLDPEGECEWRMKKNCGGGELPIVGCMAGMQEARHHGPDKNTLNNEQGNVHRICHFCHNRWHTLNDPNYVPAGLYDPHNPWPASVVDIALNEEFWDGRQTVKAKD